MSHKRNPDVLELIRGKTGRLFGKLSGFLMTVKSIPSSYNTDLNVDVKEVKFNSMSFHNLNIYV